MSDERKLLVDAAAAKESAQILDGRRLVGSGDYATRLARALTPVSEGGGARWAQVCGECGWGYSLPSKYEPNCCPNCDSVRESNRADGFEEERDALRAALRELLLFAEMETVPLKDAEAYDAALAKAREVLR